MHSTPEIVATDERMDGPAPRQASGAGTVDETVVRPWGSFRTLDAGTRYQVKQLMVHPGESLSLQMHHHRHEHWVVVSGTALVVRDGTESYLCENEHFYIAAGEKHRLKNPGKLPLFVIEVQSGSYLGEDDIVRFEDIYDRIPS